MKPFLVVFVALCALNLALGERGEVGVEYYFGDDESYTNVSGRDGRVFPFVAVVRLPDETCGSNMMTQGICRTKKQCNKQGGTVVGDITCGGGYGVCCQFQTTCSSSNNGNGITVTTSGTQIQNPSSNSLPSTCQINLQRPSSNICQVRLDFIDFNLAGPDFTGDCTMDFMTLSGAENLISPFVICGQNDGQHLYLQYGSAETITAAITLNRAMSTYNIMASYIRCPGSGSSKKASSKGSGSKGGKGGRAARTFSGSSSKGSSNSNDDSTDSTFVIEPAPAGCTQYFTETSGEVKSFNYAGMTIPTGPSTSQFQINNEKYTVCVKGGSAGSTIMWSSCDNTTVSFCISGAYGTEPSQGSPCLMDYVDIPGSPDGRYCGCGFSSTPVTSSSKPFIMYVNFNEYELPPPPSITDPETGCPMGFECLDAFGAAQMPPLNTTCNSDEGIAEGYICAPPLYMSQYFDDANTGFCLRYMVS